MVRRRMRIFMNINIYYIYSSSPLVRLSLLSGGYRVVSTNYQYIHQHIIHP